MWRNPAVLILLVTPAGVAHALDTVLVGGNLTVVLDSLLPRPSSVSFGKDNFSAPVYDVRGPPSGEWWHHISNYAISFRGDGYSSAEVPASAHSIDEQSANCAGQCNADSFCAAWNMIKVTPTSGQRGKLPLCTLYDASKLPQPDANPYRPDTNLECGSKKQLSPNTPGGEATGIYPSRRCLSIVAMNGSISRFCAHSGQTSVIYTPLGHANGNAQAVSWHLELWKEVVSAAFAGTISVSATSVLEWTLTSGQAKGIMLRALDLEFAFVGLSGVGDKFYYTSSQKTWCPPGTGCQEWSCRTHQGTVGSTVISDDTKSRVGVGWNPPSPLPWAAQALLDAARSNGVGAWTMAGDAGVGLYSSQRTLPFRRYQRSNGPIGLGSARINVNLRCGSRLPVTLRYGFFNDITEDGTVSDQDCMVYTRSQYPLADWIYRSGLIMKLGNDYTSYRSQWNPSSHRISFNETLKYIAAISDLSDGMLLVMHLVGWQGTGHDTSFPSYNVINPQLGSQNELRQVFETSKRQYNTILSYHVNTDEAYWNYTACSPDGNATKDHPVPGTKDGQHNPDCDPAIISTAPDGKMWVWGGPPSMRTDPLQGPAYHISKTKDAVSGERWRRLDEMLKTIPLAGTVHMDAYRDIDTSWESDSAGYIAEDEEMACGCEGDMRWLKKNGLSLGVEGSNGMASVGGPNTPATGVFDYYWHGHMGLGDWGRIVSGTDQGLDDDVTPSSNTNPFNHWENLADQVYLKAKPLALQMSSEKLAENRFTGGGTGKVWPIGAELIEYSRPDSNGGDIVFVPEVLPPPAGSPKSAATKVNPNKVHVYLRSSSREGTHTWQMPSSWLGGNVSAITISPQGRASGPKLEVQGRSLTLQVQPGRPIVLSCHVPPSLFI